MLLIFNVLYNYLIDWKLEFKIQPYIVTEYLYNDFFEYLVKNDKNLNYYTEGSYGKLLNINTLDLSKKNIDKIMKWGENQYNNAFLNNPSLICWPPLTSSTFFNHLLVVNGVPPILVEANASHSLSSVIGAIE